MPSVRRSTGTICVSGAKASLSSGPARPPFPLTDLLRARQIGSHTDARLWSSRYTPATSRLRELIATRLGRPLAMTVDIAAPG